jgi:hypothetical protein
LVALAFTLVSPSVRADTPGTRRIAVLVGANDPPAGRPALQFAHDDANDLADTLQRVGGFAAPDVHVLLDPHPAELIATFDEVGRTATAAGGDVLFLFYYSGHSDGQSLFPHGEAVSLSALRSRVERLGARIRIGILDTCRGGSWTQSKGLSVGPPLKMQDLLNVGTEGTALVSSSSGLENAHEATDVHGSFFTHYLTAGLRGAADRAGDGNVTLEEAFDYAKERTVRDSARLATTPQHPSFDLALRGRQDIVLTVLSSATSALEVHSAKAPIEVIHLPSGVTVADGPGGGSLRIAVPPGRYLVRSVDGGHVYAKEVEVKAGETTTLADGQLEATGSDALAMKGGESPSEDEGGHEVDPETAPPPPPGAPAAKPEKDRGRDHRGWDWEYPGNCKAEHVHTEDDEGHHSAGTAIACSPEVFGARGSVGSVTGVPSPQGAGVEAAAEGEDFWRHDRIFSGHHSYRLALGGGGAGLEGVLAANLAWGFRIPVSEEEGPVIRAGAQGYIMGNDMFFSSLIEVPQVQLGWQWASRHALFEVAATSGVALDGRFRAGYAETRDLGAGLSYGGHAALQIPWVRLSATIERLPGRDGLDFVDMGTASLCAIASPVAICADATVEQGHTVTAGTEPFSRVAVGGLTIGFTGD